MRKLPNYITQHPDYKEEEFVQTLYDDFDETYYELTQYSNGYILKARKGGESFTTK